jgi:hypothetical protein
MIAAAGGKEPGTKKRNRDLDGLMEIKDRELNWRMQMEERAEAREQAKIDADERGRRNAFVMDLIKQGKTPDEIEGYLRLFS